MPNEAMIPDGDAALILKFAAGIDKNIFSNGDICRIRRETGEIDKSPQALLCPSIAKKAC